MEKWQRNLPPLTSLLPFEAAARHESFTLAAEELGLTQAAISKQIRILEKDLGTVLFERRNRAVFLTEEGRRFGRIVGLALGDISQEATFMRKSGSSGEIVLFCQLCEAFYWLMPRLSDFHHQHPEIELRVKSSVKPIVDADQPFDVALQTTGRRHGSYPLAFTASDAVFPVCSPNYLGSDQAPLALEDLPGHVLLSHRVVPQDWLDWDGWLDEVGATDIAHLKTKDFDSYPLVLQAAVSGQGIALGWQRTVEQMLDQGILIRPCAEQVFHPAGISVFRGLRGQVSDPATEALVAWLRAELCA
ncbi:MULTISPECIES: LysR substrate-binding domain-containing protein [Thalassospira]|uniref:LysR family transcriptional regulator n=1 Tax=Thalassospira profundimaris TaxID=502049 RepID=A0A367VDA0_9PROT|nr:MULTISPECIES: LysR substrate-binding domain-containing protein [Thalassospira]KZB70119.1 LysR family transcriptional regulator [Thalassospira sp. MCCC 1A01148]RCK23195.1 LysR family transcriptional regulator [Thalassospira profundimaris]HAI30973.1 LysR family transcriptional regulator [Thalassospira sp.]|tara:strand:+ start:23042 stop:23950 length:909 start_codon:yes stop_codon:yes gene_type:complete